MQKLIEEKNEAIKTLKENQFLNLDTIQTLSEQLKNQELTKMQRGLNPDSKSIFDFENFQINEDLEQLKLDNQELQQLVQSRGRHLDFRCTAAPCRTGG